MQIEIIAPACLPLGLLPLEQAGQRTVCLTGVTLQQPLVQLTLRSQHKLTVTGGRADLARRYAQQFGTYYHLTPQADIQIEFAIPGLMGLESETMLALSVSRGLSRLHALPEADASTEAQAVGLGPRHALSAWGFQRGGLLFVDTHAPSDGSMSPIIHRHELAHPDKQAWVFVFSFPKVPPNTLATLEQERLADLVAAVPHLNAGMAGTDMLQALEHNDIHAFAHALTAMHEQTQAALAQAGTPLPPAPQEDMVLEVMRSHGALACGRTLTGLACYGLIEGAAPSRALRRALRERLQVNRMGGIVMAGITSNTGVQHTVHP